MTTIKIKNSTVAGKVPQPSDLDKGELAVNLVDKKLYSKDGNGSVVEISAQEAVEVDLSYTPAADGGTVTNTAGDDATLTLADASNAGLMAPADFSKLASLANIESSDDEPGSPAANDLWLDTSECPPELKVYSDCEDPGNFAWITIGGAEPSTPTEIATPSVLTPPNGAGLGPGAPYYPETSAITNVATGTVDLGITWTGGTVDITGSGANDGADRMFDGNTATRWNVYNNNTTAGSCTYNIPQTYVNNTGKAQTCTIYGQAYYVDLWSISLGNSSGVYYTTELITTLGLQDFTFEIPAGGELAKIKIFAAGTDGSGTEIRTIAIDGQVIGGSSTTLTLTDDKAYNAAGEEQDTLENAFEVGDTVTADGGGALNPDDYKGGTPVNDAGVSNNNTNADSIFNGSNSYSPSWQILCVSPTTGNVGSKLTLPNPIPVPGGLFSLHSTATVNPSNTGASYVQLFDQNDQPLGSAASIPNSAADVQISVPANSQVGGWRVYFDITTNAANFNAYVYWVSADGTAIGDTPAATTGTVSDVTGNTMTLSSTSGDWTGATKAINDIEKTASGPGPDDIVFTSSIPAVTSGTVTDWGNAEWQLATDNLYTTDLQTASVPITVDDAIQQVPDGTFTLEGDTQYYVRVRYTADVPSVNSSYSLSSHTFKTAAGGGGFDPALGGLVSLYNGTSAIQDVPTGVDLANNKGLVWLKARTENSGITARHGLFDTLRGPMKRLFSDGDDFEASTTNTLTSFNEDGFSVGNNSHLNYAGDDYVSWTFQAMPGLFDVIEYSGSNANNNVAHNLAQAPGLVICKAVEQDPWFVGYKDENDTYKYMYLNENYMSQGDFNMTWDENNLNLQTGGHANEVGKNYVAYLFARNTPGVIKCGLYTGNGTTQSIDVGFKPQWILQKILTTSQGWKIFDLKRGNGSSSSDAATLEPNSLAAEFNSAKFELTDTGFTCHEGNTAINAFGEKYLYVAIAAPTTRYFYDETLGTAVVGAHITQRYGLDPETNDMRHLGIYPLDQQPNFAVDAYVKEGDRYRVIRNRSAEIRSAKAEAAEATARLNERDAQIESIQAAFEARLKALEDRGDSKPSRRKKAD